MLRDELAGEVRVAFLRGNFDLERHQEEPPPHRLVDAADSRAMVARDDELVGRFEVEKACRMKWPESGSLLVSALIFASSQRRPFCVSCAMTSRAPLSCAISVGWRSYFEARNISIGAAIA